MSEYPQRAVAIITAEYIEGATLEEVAESMCDLANNLGCYVKFTYERVEMTVGFHHLPDLIIEEWKKRKAAQPKFDLNQYISPWREKGY